MVRVLSLRREGYKESRCQNSFNYSTRRLYRRLALAALSKNQTLGSTSCPGVLARRLGFLAI